MPKISEPPIQYTQPAGLGYVVRSKAMRLNMKLTLTLERVRQIRTEQAALMRELGSPTESPPTSPEQEHGKCFPGDMVSCGRSDKSVAKTNTSACASPPSPLSPQPPSLKAATMRKILGDSNGAHDTSTKSPAAH